jgi:hypothetical protein
MSDDVSQFSQVKKTATPRSADRSELRPTTDAEYLKRRWWPSGRRRTNLWSLLLAAGGDVNIWKTGRTACEIKESVNKQCV